MNSEFALALHLVLVMARYKERLFTSAELSKLLNVHSVRIRRILSLLKRHGLVDSREGARGGFTISFNPDKVTLNDIYVITQKDVLKPKCHECGKTCKVGANIAAVLNQIFSCADENLKQYLEKYTIKKVMDMME
jgi:Rrf2 family protein